MVEFFNKINGSKLNDVTDVKYYKSINWNMAEDVLDKMTWEKLTMQFWTDTRIPVSNDRKDWREMSESEQDVVNKALAGLTMLDTLQSEEGASKVSDFAHTQQEKAVMKNIEFMESMHAKSYSTIFTSLNNKAKVDEIFEWADGNELLQNKARIINEMYQCDDELTIRTASVFLESFLFYSGFFIPLYHLGNGKLVNTAEIIRLIIRDESVNCVPI